jgi:hypothetical protein
MIYLTFDSNIWIYSLDDSWKIENQLDYLEPWIENGDVKLLLPEIILQEWKNNSHKQVKHRKDQLKNFFKMAEEILPSAFFSDFKNDETQEAIINNQLDRINTVIKTSEIIPLYPEVEKQIIDWGIQRKAPLHKKSSIADAVIVYSLIQYAKRNEGNDFFFISNNTDDFYEKKQIHSDLKPDFDRYNIKAYKTLNYLTNDLRRKYSLPVSPDFELIRKNRIKNKIAETIYNPVYEKVTANEKSRFIQNVETLEFILKESKPSKEQVIFVLALIDSDIKYEEKFYNKLTNPIWFKILKLKGVFESSNNPLPVKGENGFQTPLWLPLIYLEKLSVSIRENIEDSFTDEIINIIKTVSKSPKDNYRTWYLFVRILNNFPNEKISLETLKLIKVWLEGNFNALLQTSEICQNLLPKFLSDTPTEGDIIKAEFIIKELFTIYEKTGNNETLNIFEHNYYSRVHLYHLKDAFIKIEFIEKVAKFCSNDIIIFIANNLKKLYLSFPNGLNSTLIFKDEKIKINININEKNLILFTERESENKISIGTITDFENQTKNEITQKIIELLKVSNLGYISTDDNDSSIERLIFPLFNGSYGLSNTIISRIGEGYSDTEKLEDIFLLIFRNLLNEKVKLNDLELLKLFAFDNFYRLSIYRKVLFFIIGENWQSSKSIFWKILETQTDINFFIDDSYRDDIYELLNKNQEKITKEEIIFLQKSIDILPDNKDYEKLRWYSALRKTEQFKEKYLKLSELKGLTHEHFDDLGEIKLRWSSGDISPFSLEELLAKSNAEIVNNIHSFKSKDNWNEPTASGFANNLSKMVVSKPQEVSEEIELYNNLPYIYIYHILNGFREAWKKDEKFNWEKVLNFIKVYITDKKFYSNEFYLEHDSWNTNSDWVVGAISDLLSEGTVNDKNAFDLKLLPITKEIITILTPHLKTVEDFAQTNMDYPTYSLNSTSGKVLRTLLFYSLRRARNINQNSPEIKWEKDIIKLFEDTIEREIIDGYIIMGWNFQQFYFLDKAWISKKVEGIFKLENQFWKAFLGGLTYSNPPFNKELYKLFRPLYKRAIVDNLELKSVGNKDGLIRHIVTLYFWGFEKLEKDSLVLLLVENSKPTRVLNFIGFISRQEKYIEHLDSEGIIRFEKIILDLWKLLLSKFENVEERRILIELPHLLVFVSKLDNIYTELLLKSTIYFDNYFQVHILIENLVKLRNNGIPEQTSEHISKVLNSIQRFEYFLDEDEQNIIDLITYIYKYGNKSAADDICNKIAQNGNDFILPFYNSYKN